jgi:hypothetical protein
MAEGRECVGVESRMSVSVKLWVQGFRGSGVSVMDFLGALDLVWLGYMYILRVT